MKKLLQEVTLDDKFNVQMNKIQQAIIALEGLTPELVDLGPTSSQRGALHRAALDLNKISEKLSYGKVYKK